MSTFEADHKIKAINEFRQILSGFMRVQVAQVRNLPSEAWGALSAPEKYVGKLVKLRDAIRQTNRKFEDLQKQYREYPDILNTANLEHGRALLSAVEDHLSKFQVTAKKKRDQDEFNVMMGSNFVSVSESTDQMTRWLNAAEQTLVDLRQALSP